MNIKEYISSGVVESYVLGLLTAHERFEFEQYCETYPELRAARDSFELAIEKQAMENAERPPAHIKERVWEAIQQKSESKPSKIISMEPTSTRRSHFGWLAAASVILFLVAGYFAYNFYNKNKDLETANSDLEAKVNRTDSILNKLLDDQRRMNDPNVTVVNMVGLQKAVPGSASVYWDSTSTNVYLIVKNMPKLPSTKQYQLWALIDKQAVDLGLFDPPAEPNVILKMKNTQRADAFAISVEDRGDKDGKPNDVQSMGKTKLQ